MPLPFSAPPSTKVTPICPYFGICGGCDSQDIAYDEQVIRKEIALQALFKPLVPETVWLPFLASSEKYPIFFRNKIRFSFVEKDGHIWPSRHSRGEEEADIAVDVCFLQSEEANELMHFIARYAEEQKWPLFNPKTSTGWLKHILIRQGKQTNEIMLSLVTTNQPVPEVAAFIQAITRTFPHLTSLYQSQTTGRSNEQITDYLLWGEPVIHERIGKYLFRISPEAFFQTNSSMVETLYRAILDQVPQNSSVWDLYAGSATIGTFISQKASRVISIEHNPQNNEDALWNTQYNQVTNLTLANGSVEAVCTSNFINEQGKPDCVIVDPPRAGLSASARNMLAGLRPERLIYISCNPLTCLRDCREFLQRGFHLELLQGIDMFPHTNHCEMIAVLT